MHYGTGCFEGIRAYWNAAHEQLYLLQAAAHYARLRRSAAILRMDLPHSNQELVDLTLEILRRNEARTDTYVRPLVFISAEEIGVRLHGLKRSFLIYTAPMATTSTSSSGIRCMTSSWRRISDAAIPGAGQDHRLLRQLGTGQVGSAAERLRRSDHADARRPCQRGLGREPVHGARRRLHHAAGDRGHPRRHHARRC